MCPVSSLDDQAEFVHAFDRLAACRDAELAVERDRVRLDGVARDEEPLADLGERQIEGNSGNRRNSAVVSEERPSISPLITLSVARSSSACAWSAPRSGRC